MSSSNPRNLYPVMVGMNNSVKDWQGNIVGFRCWRCGGVFDSMWGETCNGCRHQDEENGKLRKEIQELREALKTDGAVKR